MDKYYFNLWNDNRRTKFIYFPYNHYIKDKESLFKEFDTETAYNPNKLLKMFKEFRKSKLRVHSNPKYLKQSVMVAMKSITAKVKYLLEQAAANTWHLKNSVGEKN